MAEIKRRADAMADRYAYEGLGADFETNGPWVAPSAKKAEAYKRAEVFGGGRAACCRFNDDDFAQLGVGVALYFKTLKALAAVFCVLTALSLPMWAFYVTGLRMQTRLPDPLKVGHSSIGNIGPLTYDAAVALKTSFSCPSSSLSSNLTSVFISSLTSGNVSGFTSSVLCALYANPELVGLTYFSSTSLSLTVEATQAAYVLTVFDLLQVLVLLLFTLILKGETERFVSYAERKNVSAADYTVYVRGLPRDATLDEVRDHFSRLFALDGHGVDVQGNWSDAKNKTMVERTRAALAGGGQAAASGLVRPQAQRRRSALASSRGLISVPADPKELRKAAASAKKAIERRRRHGHVSDADVDASFIDRVDSLGLGVVCDSSHNNDASYVDTWVADVSLVRASNKLLTTYIAAELTTERLREARATVKMWSPGTPLPKGANDAQRMRAVKAVDSLGSQLAMLHESVRRRYGKKGDLAYLDRQCVGSAYVTFNCEESRNRCLVAYQGSNIAFLRSFQSAHLRIRCPAAPGFHTTDGQEVVLDRRGRIDWRPWYKDARSNYGRGFQLLVEEAPDPSDVIHENLAITDRSRCVRQSITGCVTFLLVAIGLAIMIVAQGFSATVASKTPDLTLCSGEVPALFFGGYANLTSAEQALTSGFGTAFNAPREGTLSSAAPVASSRRRLRATDPAPAARHAEDWERVVDLPFDEQMALGRSWTTALASRTVAAEEESRRRRAALQTLLARPGAPDIGAGRRLQVTPTPSATPAPSLLTTTATLTTPVLTRLKFQSSRTAEDAMCAAVPLLTDTRRLVAYRYNFSDVAVAWRKDYPFAPFNRSGKLARAGATAYDFGTAVNYAEGSANFAAACSLATAKGLVASVSNGSISRSVGVNDDYSVTDDDRSPALPLNDVACPDPRLVAAGVGFCPCAPTQSSAQCYTLPCFRPLDQSSTHLCRTFTADTLVGCYCEQSLANYVTDQGDVNGFVAYSNDEKDTCSAFISAYLESESIIVLSSGMASVVNVVLGLIIPVLTDLEGHVSLSERSRSLAVKVAAAQTVNTGLTALVVNAALPPDSTYKLPDIVASVGLLDGAYSDFVTPWYGVVGTTIATTALINTLIPPVLMSLEYVLDACGRRSALGTPGAVVTQAQMDELFVGARFATPPRYPLVITMVVVSLTYSSGLPVLLPLAATGFILQYTVDKWMLLKFYRKPPAYDAGMTRLLLTILPWAVLCHLGFATWQFSSGSLPSAYLSPNLISYVANLAGLGSSVGSSAGNFLALYSAAAAAYDPVGAVPRILRLNTFPLALAFVLLLVFLVVANLLSTLGGVIYSMLTALTCGCVCCRCCARGGMVHVKKRRATAKVVDAAVIAMREFMDHVRVFRRYATIKAGLLYEALFLRRIKESLEEEGGAPAVAMVLDCETTGLGKGLAAFLKAIGYNIPQIVVGRDRRRLAPAAGGRAHAGRPARRGGRLRVRVAARGARQQGGSQGHYGAARACCGARPAACARSAPHLRARDARSQHWS